MKKNTVFRGAATALITPLTPDGIDYDLMLTKVVTLYLYRLRKQFRRFFK